MFFPSSFFPQLYSEHDVIGSGINLGSNGVKCSDFIPSQLLVYPQAPRWLDVARGRKGIRTGQTLLSNKDNIALLINLISSTNPRHNPIVATVNKSESYHSQNQHNFFISHADLATLYSLG